MRELEQLKVVLMNFRVLNEFGNVQALFLSVV